MRRTALHLAAERGRQQIVDCLLAANADTGTVDCDGNTPFQIAMKWGHEALARCIEAAEKS